MKKITTKTIKLHELFGSTIGTRDAARLVLREINELITKKNVKSISVSFINVEFISRSFADELWKIKNKVEEQRKISVRFIYTNKAIKHILKKVSETQNRKIKIIYKLSVFTADDTKKLEKVLHTV